MQSKLQRWWLYSCFAAVLLAGWAGGFGVIFMLVFITIYLVGVALIGPEEPSDEPEGSQAGEEDEEAESELSSEQ